MHSIMTNNRRQLLPRLIAGILILVFLLLGYIGFTYYGNLRPVSMSEKVVIVEIAPGSDNSSIAEKLHSNGLIRDSRAFLWYLKLHKDTQPKAGSYKLSPSMSVEDIVKYLNEGKVATDLFTIFPAQRIDQIKAAFIDAGYPSDQVAAALDPKLYASHPVFTGIPLPSNLEGFLYPESFFRSSDVTPQTIVKQSLDEMAKALTPEIRSGINAQGITIYQGIILASIIQQEVSNPEDEAQVAQVFYLRLKKGIPLGSDPTAFYESRAAGQPDSVFASSPYNTRINAGLPPTPIGNVNLAALKAVANPAQGDFLYFVADDNGADKGKTFFSRTLAEHEALTQEHCVILCN